MSGRDGLELLFEYGSDAPYCLHLSAEQCDRLLPDTDQGFGELLERIVVGELWFSPRIFREHDDDPETLGEDARAFRREAHRRVQAPPPAEAVLRPE